MREFVKSNTSVMGNREGAGKGCESHWTTSEGEEVGWKHPRPLCSLRKLQQSLQGLQPSGESHVSQE